MTSSRELREKRGTIIAQMEDVLKQIGTETTETRRKELEKQFDGWELETRDLEKQIERVERVEALSKENAGKHIEAEERSGRKPSGDKNTEVRAAFENYFRYGMESLSAEERDVLQTIRREVRGRELRGTNPQSTTGNMGGYTIPTGFMPELEKDMEDYSGILQAARVIRSSRGNTMYWPMVDDTAQLATLVSENASTTVADITFAQKQLDAYVLRTLALASEEILQDSEFNMEEIIRDLFAERFGRPTNTYLTTGSGSSQPNGVVTASTLGKTAASATEITFDELIDLVHSVDPAYRGARKAAFMFHDNVLAHIKKISIGASDARSLWMPSYVAGEPDRIDGYRYYINQAMDSSINASSKLVLFGDFSKYIVRIVRDVEIRRLNERYAENLQVGFIGFFRFDGELIQPNAVKHLITAAS
jgi:HK97 family phage major capsid protein